MKKWQLLIFIISIAVMLPAVIHANLLKNPDFEKGSYVNDQTLPTYWQNGRNDGASWCTWKNYDRAHSGDKFIAVGGMTDTDCGYYKQNVSNIRPGTVYRFTAWVATEIWSDYPSKPTAYLKVKFKDDKDSVLRTDKLAVLTGENSKWNFRTLITKPSPSRATKADFICYGKGIGTVLFDDVGVEAQPKDN